MVPKSPRRANGEGFGDHCGDHGSLSQNRLKTQRSMLAFEPSACLAPCRARPILSLRFESTRHAGVEQDDNGTEAPELGG